MPVTKELTIRIEDRPGTLGKAFKALGDRQVNVLAFQSSHSPEGKALVRFVVDNPKSLKSDFRTVRACWQKLLRVSAKPTLTSTTDIAGSSQPRMHRCWFLALQRLAKRSRS